MYICMTNLYACICIYIFIFTYIYIYIYICSYIYIYIYKKATQSWQPPASRKNTETGWGAARI